MTRPHIQVLGIKELRSALRNVDKSLGREVGKTLKDGAKIAQGKARGLTPKRTRRLEASIKAGASGASAYIRSTLIYAAVHEYGGHVGRKHSVRIQATHSLERGVDAAIPEIIETIGDGIEQLAERNGF